MNMLTFSVWSYDQIIFHNPDRRSFSSHISSYSGPAHSLANRFGAFRRAYFLGTP